MHFSPQNKAKGQQKQVMLEGMLVFLQKKCFGWVQRETEEVQTAACRIPTL
jgi:hypothetical protein